MVNEKNMYERYDRQLLMIGFERQLKLYNSRVAVIGAGGLGSPVILYLAAAGIGKIIVVDNDTVSLSDLNRQIIYTEADVGRKKVDVVCERIKSFNSSIDIECIDVEFNWDNGVDIVKNVDIVIDAVDNWETRFAINNICINLRKPFVHAGILGWYGQITTIVPGKTPCLQCIMPKPIPRKKIPVIGVTPGVLGVLEAAEALKYLLGVGDLLMNKLLIVDLQYNEFRIIEIKRNPACPICKKVL